MSRIALLDVNLLVALFFPDHIHHDLAHDWFETEAKSNWATCPITENGFIRVAAQQAYESAAAARPASLLAHFRKFCTSRGHHFWPDALSLHDESVFRSEFIRGHRQITDVYLLALAKSMKGSLATFDRTIPIEAVIGAKRSDLTIISP